jgi:sigma-E factor negative regulatory protein RseC
VIGRKFTQFQAENNVNAIVGDTVIVGIAEDALLKGSLVMYVVPLLGMLVFALLADFVLVESAQSRDLMISLSSIMGLVFGSVLSRWYFQRRASVQLFSPVILRKITEHGKLPVL